MQEQYDVIVVGGSAAGCLRPSMWDWPESGCLLLERNDRLGKKLRITGKGRCNVTNCCTAEEVLATCATQWPLSLQRGDPVSAGADDGVSGGRGLPAEDGAGQSGLPGVGQLRQRPAGPERALGRAGVTVRQSRVLEVWTDAGQVAGVRTDQEQIPAGKVILATGGCSYPATGSTGDGYRMAAQLGHTVIPPTGSLVPLEEAGTDCGQMQGLSLRNVAVRLVHEKGSVCTGILGNCCLPILDSPGPRCSAPAPIWESRGLTNW